MMIAKEREKKRTVAESSFQHKKITAIMLEAYSVRLTAGLFTVDVNYASNGRSRSATVQANG